jgi:hypothetical protein
MHRFKPGIRSDIAAIEVNSPRISVSRVAIVSDRNQMPSTTTRNYRENYREIMFALCTKTAHRYAPI